MRSTGLLVTTFVIVSIFLISSMTMAEPITWTTQQYRAAARDSESYYNDVQESFGPPLPISAFATYCYINQTYASAFVSDSIINLSGYAKTSECIESAYGSFSGIYKANQPTFQFYYNYDSISFRNSASIRITNSTSGVTLYDNSRSIPDASQGTDTISVNTPIGDDISVYFLFYLNAIPKGLNNHFNVSYSMSAVAPEPISSVLFVTGGTLLAGRSYLRKKKKA